MPGGGWFRCGSGRLHAQCSAMRGAFLLLDDSQGKRDTHAGELTPATDFQEPLLVACPWHSATHTTIVLSGGGDRAPAAPLDTAPSSSPCAAREGLGSRRRGQTACAGARAALLSALRSLVAGLSPAVRPSVCLPHEAGFVLAASRSGSAPRSCRRGSSQAQAEAAARAPPPGSPSDTGGSMPARRSLLPERGRGGSLLVRQQRQEELLCRRRWRGRPAGHPCGRADRAAPAIAGLAVRPQGGALVAAGSLLRR